MTPSNIMEGFQKAAEGYLNDDRFSDFTITCAGKDFKVHRCFICAHSKWFERCCSGMFQEPGSRSVELKDDLLAAVERMIHFFYAFDYNDDMPAAEPMPGPKDAEPATKLQMDAHMYAIAEKYEIPALKELAFQKFKAAGAVLQAHQPGASSQLQHGTYTVFKHISLPANDRKLKGVIVGMWVIGGYELLKQLSADAWTDLFNDLPEFAMLWTRRLMRGHTGQITQICKSCRKSEAFPRNTVATVDFKCGSCGGTEAEENVIDPAPTVVWKYW